MQPEHIHGTAILLGDRGVLIVGPSGAGKTTLALALLDHFAVRGMFCRLVGDDQLLASAGGGRLICRVPSTIAGLAEVPGLGPRPIAHEPAAVIDLCLRLVAADALARFQEPARETIMGCAIPRIDLARRDVVAAVPVVAAWLSAWPFA